MTYAQTTCTLREYIVPFEMPDELPIPELEVARTNEVQVVGVGVVIGVKDTVDEVSTNDEVS